MENFKPDQKPEGNLLGWRGEGERKTNNEISENVEGKIRQAQIEVAEMFNREGDARGRIIDRIVADPEFQPASER
mgnify:CR=1 FL=1